MIKIGQLYANKENPVFSIPGKRKYWGVVTDIIEDEDFVHVEVDYGVEMGDSTNIFVDTFTREEFMNLCNKPHSKKQVEKPTSKKNIQYEQLLISPATPISVTLRVDDLERFAVSIVEKTIAALKQTPSEEVTWLTPEQVCSRMGVDRSTLWRWNKEEYLTHQKFGRRVRYRESDVNRILTTEKVKHHGNKKTR